MKSFVSGVIGAACALVLLTGPAIAGPAFAYSWLTTDKPFGQCMTAAGGVIASGNYAHVETTRFGVTGETDKETLYINCEDARHVSLVLMRAERPRRGEIDRLVARMQEQLRIGAVE